MASTVTILHPAALCVIMILISCSEEMPLHTQPRRNDCSPNPERDLILGLRTMAKTFATENKVRSVATYSKSLSFGKNTHVNGTIQTIP